MTLTILNVYPYFAFWSFFISVERVTLESTHADVSILHHFRHIATFTVYVTAHKSSWRKNSELSSTYTERRLRLDVETQPVTEQKRLQPSSDGDAEWRTGGRKQFDAGNGKCADVVAKGQC